jgi:hypothetical protein
MKEKKICDCSKKSMPNMGGGGGGVEISNSAPVSAKAGSLWSDTDDNKLYRRTDDGTAWKEVFSDGNNVPISGGQVVLAATTTEGDYTLPSAVAATANQSGYVGSTATGGTVDVGEPNNRFKSEFQAGSTLLGLTVTKIQVYAKLSSLSHGTNQLTIQCCKGAGNTGASFGSFQSDATTPVISTSGQWLEKGSLNWLVEEGDGIGMKIGTTGIVGKGYRHSDDRDNEITITGGGASICSPSSPSTSNDDMSAQYFVDYNANGIILSGGGYYKSTDTTNPYIRVDMGATKNIGGIMFHNTSDTTATTVTVDFSANGTDFTTARTILVSKLTDDSDNHIRFNMQATRYVRVRSSDSGNTVLSTKKFYVLEDTGDEVADNHGHLSISTTDTNLTLAGLPT